MARNDRREPRDTAPPPAAPESAPVAEPTPQPATGSPAPERHEAAEVTEQIGIWSSVLGVIAFIASGFKTEDGRIVAQKGFTIALKSIQLGWRHLTRDRGKVSQFGRELGKHATRFARGQVRDFRRERQYREGLGLFGNIRRAASPVPAWLDTMSNAHRASRRRRSSGLGWQLMQSMINRFNRPQRTGPRPPGFWSRLGDAIISRVRRNPEGGSPS